MDGKKRTEYWASLPFDEFIDEAHARIREFYDDLESTGLYYAVERCYRAYYGANLADGEMGGELFDSARLTRRGKNSEITMVKANHLRNLVKHTLQLATSNKAATSCRAANTDYKSQTQTILGKGVVDYYFTEKKVGRQHSKAIENGLITTEGWVHTPWNPTKGRKFENHPETGAPIFEGDLEFTTGTLLDVPRDISLSEDDANDWLFFRTWVNKFDLAAKLPALAEEIISESNEISYADFDSFKFQIRQGDLPDSDRVCLWHFYHEKTDAMPVGRMVSFVNSIKIFDGPTPYDEIPLWRFSPDRLMGTPYGYTPAFEILGLQQGVDILSSTIMTNNATNGVQNLWTKRKDNLSVTTLSGGMKNLQSDEKPEPIQLTQTAPETFNFRKDLIGEMETIIGISATVRGNPEASLKSGSALALVVSQSIQFAYLIEEDSNALIEDLGTAIIKEIRTFGKTPRIANIIGQSSRPFMKEFSADDLSEINRVVVEQVNPLSKTVAGRIQIADSLLEKGFIKNANQYIMVLTTGNLDPSIEGIEHQLLNIRAENEEMRNGRKVIALIIDRHADHILEHADILANPESRRHPERTKIVLDHIQEHLNLWRQADPGILLVTGQQPAPPPPGPAIPPPQPGAPAGAGSHGAPQQGGTIPAQLGPPQNPMAEQMPNMPNQPNLPAEAPAEAQVAFEKTQLNAA